MVSERTQNGIVLGIAVVLIILASLSFGPEVRDAGVTVEEPEVDITFDIDRSVSPPVLVVIHDGGDTFVGETTRNVVVNVDGKPIKWAGVGTNAAVKFTDDELNAGETLRIPISDESPASPGAFVEVVWTGQDGSSKVLASFTVPGEESLGTAPDVEFDVVYVSDTEELRFTHDGGPVLNASNSESLKFEIVDGAESELTFEEQAFAENDTVVLNASGVESGDQVRVTWTSPTGDAIVVFEKRVFL